MEHTFVAIDVETANPDHASICQIGAVLVQDCVVSDTWASLIDPEAEFDPWNVQIHGITRAMVHGQPRLPDVIPQLLRLIGPRIVAAHTAFDRLAISRACTRYALDVPAWTWLDTSRVARRTWRQFARKGYGLASVAAHCGINFRHHDAVEDARAAAEVLVRAMQESGRGLQDWLQRVRQPIDPTRSRVSRDGDPQGPLAGHVVVFTGALSIPRVEAAALASTFGCTVRDSVSRSTTMLVVGQQDLTKLGGYEKSSKQRKAEALIAQGIDLDILSEDDFMCLANVPT